MPVKMGGVKNTNNTSALLSNANRLQRNRAEKQRRDKLNSYISELATIVPLVSMSSKRLDKTSILRLSAAHLRINQSSLNSRCKKPTSAPLMWRPNFLNVNHLKKLLDALDGFLLVTNLSGKIVYASQAVEHYLGHQNIELLGYSLFSFLHPDDIKSVQKKIEQLASQAPHDTEDKWYSERISFYCRIREHNQPRSEVMTYQLVHVSGHMTLNVDLEQNFEPIDAFENLSASPEVLFKAFIHVKYNSSIQELNLGEFSQDEYITRHRFDGTIIHADQRISTIIGFLPHEVYMKNAYEFICPVDIPVAQFAQKLMFTSNNGTGFVIHRLMTGTKNYVYLQTRGSLIFDKSSGQLDHFICINRLLSNEEGEEELKKFVDQYSPLVASYNGVTKYDHLLMNKSNNNNHLPQLPSSPMSQGSNSPEYSYQMVDATLHCEASSSPDTTLYSTCDNNSSTTTLNGGSLISSSILLSDISNSPESFQMANNGFSEFPTTTAQSLLVDSLPPQAAEQMVTFSIPNGLNNPNIESSIPPISVAELTPTVSSYCSPSCSVLPLQPPIVNGSLTNGVSDLPMNSLIEMGATGITTQPSCQPEVMLGLTENPLGDNLKPMQDFSSLKPILSAELLTIPDNDFLG